MCATQCACLSCCGKKTGAICVAVYKAIFIIVAIVLTSVAIVIYEDIEDHNEMEARINSVIRGCLVATIPLCVILLSLHILLLWAAVKKKISPIRWWIRISVIVEVLTCSSMFMVKWDTLRSACLILNFVLNLFLLKIVCAYEQSLKDEDEKEIIPSDTGFAESGAFPTPSTSLM